MCPVANASRNPLPEWPEEWVIAPDARMGVRQRVEEVWRYRRILWFFTLKSATRLWANTRMGPIVIVLRSVVPVIVGSIAFGVVMDVQSPGVPYFLFLLAGSTIWGCFDGPLTWATRGLEMNRQLLTKLYLPRMVLPAAQMSAGLVEVAVLLAMLAISIAYYRYADGVWYSALTPRLAAAPLAMSMAILLAFAVSLWTSVWQARARDMRFVLAYVVGFWAMLTPVIYPISQLPPNLRWLAAINPMTGPVEAFKWSVLGLGVVPVFALAVSTGVTLIILSGGLWYFTTHEGQIADRL